MYVYWHKDVYIHIREKPRMEKFIFDAFCSSEGNNFRLEDIAKISLITIAAVIGVMGLMDTMGLLEILAIIPMKGIVWRSACLYVCGSASVAS